MVQLSSLIDTKHGNFSLIKVLEESLVSFDLVGVLMRPEDLPLAKLVLDCILVDIVVLSQFLSTPILDFLFFLQLESEDFFLCQS